MNSVLKILYVTSGLKSGGKERQLIEIVKNLDKNYYKIGIVTFGKNHHYSTIAKTHCDYFCELNKRPTRLEPFFTIWKCYHDFKPDIVHTWDSLSTMYALVPSKCYKIKLIDGSIRDAGIDKGWEYYFKRFFINRAAIVLSNSNAGLKAYQVDGHVIYNAIDTSRFHPPTQNQEFNILMTANFSKYKDHQTFLNAAVLLITNKLVDNVYLIGDGPYRRKYRSWIGSEFPEIAHKFHFTGAVGNVEEYLSKCHVGVLCSTTEFSEGLSNAVLEYMAAGLVPIVTDLGGSSEIIEHGINGYLIDPGNDNEIVEIVRLLSVNKILFNSITIQAKQTIEKKFSMAQSLFKLELLYKIKQNCQK